MPGVRNRGLRRGLAAVAALVSLAAGGRAPGRCDETLQVGDYLLCTQVLHAGTRSEGRVGRLFLGDREVAGRAVGETIEVVTSERTVRFTFLGAQRPHLWSNSGWTAGPRS